MKRVTVLVLTLLLVSLVLLISCAGVVAGSRDLTTKTYNFSDFTTIEAHQGFQVELSQSTEFSIEITIDDNLVEYLEIDKSGSTLIIRLKQNRMYTLATLRAKVTLPDIDRLDLSGGSQAEVTGFDLSHNLSIELSGGSRVTGDISADDVDLKLSGGSRIELVGSADNLVTDGSGGSQLELGSFPVDNANIKISGGGRATVDVSGTLDLDISGGSRVIYDGEPQIGDIDLSGGSTMKRK
ncbi:head GIN domain-containing protein [Chloroflexota bacterium]